MFTNATALIARGTHQRDRLPDEGGRWPVSVVLRPPGNSTVAKALDALTAEAAALAGPGHWQTGQRGSAHLTVRALEGHRAVVPPDDLAVRRYAAAIDRAAVGPASFRVTGLTLTPGSVMACAFPLDPYGDLFMNRLAAELGPDGWFEGDERRDIWYLNLLHFTTDIPAPDDLVSWVAKRRSTPIGDVTVPAPELIRFRYCDGPRPHMRPVRAL